jgi:hypothetical protein
LFINFLASSQFSFDPKSKHTADVTRTISAAGLVYAFISVISYLSKVSRAEIALLYIGIASANSASQSALIAATY